MRARAVVWLLLLFAVLALAAWRLWPGEERRVRSRLEALATELSIPPGEAGMARMTRAVGVRTFFTEDVVIEIVEGAVGPTIRGRDEIAGYVARLAVPPEGTRVELVTVETEIGPGRRDADVRVATRVVAREPRDSPPILDARRIALTLRKVDGDWLIANARVMPTDDSLGIR